MYFPPNSDTGTVVFCAKRNYDYYFDNSAWVLPWVQYKQVPIFLVGEFNSEVDIDAVEHIQISVQNMRLLEF